MASLGENRVKVDFNVDGSTYVDNIKRKSAEMINLAEDMRVGGSSERQRLISLAQTAYEEACMWLVKANHTE